jgi:hypothetical protein
VGKNHLGDPGVDGRIIIKWIFRSRMWGYGLDIVVQVRDTWWTLVSAVMNPRVS